MAKVSSVMPKARNIFTGRGKDLKRSEREALINRCLRFKKKVAIIISKKAVPPASKFKAANWLAPAKTIRDMEPLSILFKPLVLAKSPKAIATVQ
ncbi:hypothetical protein ES708_16308 [subsurface metagenome]